MKLYLRNRYKQNVTLTLIKENIYKLDVSDCHFSRTGFFDDGKTIEFIDPEGGPFLEVSTNTGIAKINMIKAEDEELPIGDIYLVITNINKFKDLFVWKEEN